MKNLFKTIIWMAVCAVQLSAASYQWNSAELTRFGNTMVNVTPEIVLDVLGAYFDSYPDRHRLHPGNVNGSIMMAPMPGQKGDIDETLTALRFDPMDNWYVSVAQYMFAVQALNDKIKDLRQVSIDNLRATVASDDKRIQDLNLTIESLRTNLTSSIEMIGQMQTLINLTEAKDAQNADRISNIKSDLQSLAQRAQLAINL